MNNLPTKKEEGIMNKVKQFFMRLFYSNNEQSIAKTFQKENDNFESTEKSGVFINDIKEEINHDASVEEIEQDRNSEKEAMLDKIAANPEVLDTLSIEKLIKIDEYCDVSINNYKDKLKNKQGET